MRQARERRAAGEPAQIGEAMLAQYGCEPVRGTLAVGRDRGMPARLAFGIQILADSVEQIGVGVGALGGKILGRPRPGIKVVGSALLGRAKWREPDDGAGAQPLFPFRVIEEHLLGSDRAIQRSGAAGLGGKALPRRIEIGDRVEPVGRGLLCLIIERNWGLWKVIKQRFKRLVIERQPVFHPAMPPPRAYRLVQRITAADRAELLAVARG